MEVNKDRTNDMINVKDKDHITEVKDEPPDMEIYADSIAANDNDLVKSLKKEDTLQELIVKEEPLDERDMEINGIPRTTELNRKHKSPADEIYPNSSRTDVICHRPASSHWGLHTSQVCHGSSSAIMGEEPANAQGIVVFPVQCECDARPIDDEQCKQLKGILPPQYEYKICSYTQEEDGFCATIHLKLRTADDACEWQREFQTFSKTTMRIQKTFPNISQQSHNLYKVELQCHHKTRSPADGRFSSENIGCSAAMRVTVKNANHKRIRSKDGHFGEFPMTVKMWHIHNHPINCADASCHRDVSDQTAGKFLNMFRSGNGGECMEKQGRVRSRNVAEWQQNVAKKRRNLGLEYVSHVTKKRMPARKIGAPCPDGCFEKLGREIAESIFNAFWALGDYNAQNSYLQSLIREEAVKRKRSHKEVTQRPVLYMFHVKVNQMDVQVCRKAFISIHGLSEKKVRLLILKRKTSPHGTVPDRRGHHPSGRAITGERLERVHEHIQSLPVTASHYSRALTPHQKYLESGGTINDLYSRYVIWMNENYSGEEQVSERFYRDTFVKDYNIVFQAPGTNTCNTCAKYEIMMKSAAGDQGKIAELEASLAEHKAIAQVPQDLLHENEQVLQSGNNTNLKVVCIDLQQAMPCPRLNFGIAYYKRKMWVYNFCVYDINEKEGTMFVWDEATAGRGSDEMASCMLKWLHRKIDQQGQNFVHLRIFCEHCTGQNKNINMLLMALQQVHSKRLFRVEFIFMKSGHSYLPCDQAFGSIEKRIQKAESIATPKDYIDIIRSAVKKKFPVVAMERQDFMDMKALQAAISQRSAPGFAEACQLVITQAFPEGYIIKNDYVLADNEADIKKICLMKGEGAWSLQRFNLANHQLTCKYPNARLLSEEKCQDLRILAGLLGDQAKAWFTALLDHQDTLRAAGGGTEDTEEVLEDPDNILMDYVPVK